MMKKLYLIIFLFLAGIQVNFAQQQDSFEELRQQMEEMQKELFKQFENLDMNGSGFQFFIDTMMIPDFGDMGMDLQPFGLTDPTMLNDWLGEMQKQLSEMSEEDWAEIERLFKGFGENGFIMPFPQAPATPKEDEKTIIVKKKRKTYKL